MGERAAHPRPLKHALLFAVAGATLLAGCAGGPAENRAQHVGIASDPSPPSKGTDGMDGEGASDGSTGDPTEEPEPVAPAEGSADSPVTTEVEGLEDPCCLAPIPGGEDVLVGSRSGALVRVTAEGESTPVGQIPALSQERPGELLGIALDPGHEDGEDSWIYASYSTSEQVRIARLTYEQEAGLGSTPGILAGQLPLAESGSGGALTFGPEGMLYVATGGADAEEAGDPESLAGKILRLEPNTTDSGGHQTPDPRIYSAGYPQVRGLAHDPARDRLWAVTVTEEDVAGVAQIPPGGAGEAGAGGTPLTWDSEEVGWPAETSDPVGVGYAAGSLWVPSSGDAAPLSRLPLDGPRLTGPPQPLTPEAFPSPVATAAGQDGESLLVLGADGTLTRYRVS
ncbi:Glucose / Sorbosone dehydrogenase [Streptomyces zhaozhouensis]|uniref:Glucose / Sorbosone dehydrogenase n=1 Tax=Streptomyces zhaozhouensis TaxID=1300267 RepID=A0A286E6M9_9ACTN|nr:PQQ-dependent sugar dehydrogenase [Streptomyces zhaozhouensis]SOD66546.1 Glucose / Sorbosone dehydrogenase [Streptomyces zhaozhouensis]